MHVCTTTIEGVAGVGVAGAVPLLPMGRSEVFILQTMLTDATSLLLYIKTMRTEYGEYINRNVIKTYNQSGPKSIGFIQRRAARQKSPAQ